QTNIAGNEAAFVQCHLFGKSFRETITLQIAPFGPFAAEPELERTVHPEHGLTTDAAHLVHAIDEPHALAFIAEQRTVLHELHASALLHIVGEIAAQPEFPAGPGLDGEISTILGGLISETIGRVSTDRKVPAHLVVGRKTGSHASTFVAIVSEQMTQM